MVKGEAIQMWVFSFNIEKGEFILINFFALEGFKLEARTIETN